MTRFVTAFNYFGVHEMYPDITRENLVVYDASHEFEKGDILILEGGTDINPSIYGERKERYTQSPDTQRDEIEVELFNKAVFAGVPILGICRGAQLACALSGGKLIQHIDGHTRSHEVLTDKDELYTSSSCHHQAMSLEGTDHHKIAWSVRDEIPEVVFFGDTKCLAIQGHPEFMNMSDPFVGYTERLIREYLL